MADQFLAAPFFAVTFFMGAGLLEGKSVGGSWQEFKMKFPAVYAVSKNAVIYFFLPQKF